MQFITPNPASLKPFRDLSQSQTPSHHYVLEGHQKNCRAPWSFALIIHNADVKTKTGCTTIRCQVVVDMKWYEVWSRSWYEVTNLGFITSYFDKVAEKLSWQRVSGAKFDCRESSDDVPREVDSPLLYISQRMKQCNSACLWKRKQTRSKRSFTFSGIIIRRRH